jgi:hypothetical protein
LLRHRFRYTFLFAVALAAGIVLHLLVLGAKRSITQDEGISYMAATGHLGTYDRAAAASGEQGTWQAAAEWKELMRAERALCFGTIGSDLARHDVHPPLYFWLLHVWVLLLGAYVWSGPVLNLFIALITFGLLSRLARRVLGNRLLGLAAAFVWLVSSVTVVVTAEARQYDLLALFTVSLALLAARMGGRGTDTPKRDVALLAAVSAGGLLTHYHFALPLAGVALWAVVVLLRRDRQSLVRLAGGLGAGVMLSVLLHPRFYLSFSRALGGAPGKGDIAVRLGSVLSAAAAFFLPAGLATWAGGTALGVVLIASWVAWRRRAPSGPPVSRELAWFLFWWLLCLLVMLHVLHLTPPHATGGKYLSMWLPFFAMVPFMLVAGMRGRFRLYAAVLICAWQLVVGLGDTVFVARMTARARASVAPLEQARTVVIDNVARAALPAIVWHIPDRASVFAAPQRVLVAEPAPWRERLDEGALYVNVFGYGNSWQGMQDIVALVASQRDIRPLPSGIAGLCGVFVAGQPAPSTPGD